MSAAPLILTAALLLQPRGKTVLPPPVLEKGNVILTVSDSGKSVYGYSANTGEYDKLTLKRRPEDPVTPLLSNNIACFGAEGFVFAYGARSAKWGAIKVGEFPRTGIQPIMSSNLVLFENDKKVYAFGADSEEWAIVEVDNEVELPAKVEGGTVRLVDGRKIHLYTSGRKEWVTLDLRKD